MKVSVAHPNPGKRSTENFTKISRQISRHLWQRKTEKNSTSALLQGSCSENSVLNFGSLNQKCPQYCWEFHDRLSASERPSPEPLLKKRRVPSRTGGGENSGNALEASNALNCRAWGIPAVFSRGIPGKTLRAFPGSFQKFSGISSGKSQPCWGCGPLKPSKSLWPKFFPL